MTSAQNNYNAWKLRNRNARDFASSNLAEVIIFIIKNILRQFLTIPHVKFDI